MRPPMSKFLVGTRIVVLQSIPATLRNEGNGMRKVEIRVGMRIVLLKEIPNFHHLEERIGNGVEAGTALPYGSRGVISALIDDDNTPLVDFDGCDDNSDLCRVEVYPDEMRPLSILELLAEASK